MTPASRPAGRGARTIGALLADAAAALDAVGDTPRLDAEVLLEHASGIARSWMLAFPETPVDTQAAGAFDDLVTRRARGEPVAYVTGVKEFYSLPFEVTPAVLVPRPETELLVSVTLERAPPGGRVLDLGTGSGAIAIAVKHERPDLDVTAVDASVAALAVARRNAARSRAEVRFIESDWCAALGDERFDVIASNPPYVPRVAASCGALAFEPALALDGGADGLDALRALVASAPPRLAPGGVLVVEHGYDQRSSVTTLAAGAGLAIRAALHDLAGQERALVLARRTD